MYGIIVVDPPWPITKIKQQAGFTSSYMDYPVLSLDEIYNLRIRQLAAPTAMCFLWTIDKYLYAAPYIMCNWGFNYHLTMVWNKTNGMALYGFNRQTEFVIVGLCGSNETYPYRPTMRSIFTEKHTGHSIKPECFYKSVEQIPLEPRIDVFARKERKGWDVWGNEVENTHDYALLP